MIDPAASYNSKLAGLANAGRQGLPIAEIGIGTAVHMAVTGRAEPVDTRRSDRVVATREGRAMAMQQQEWA